MTPQEVIDAARVLINDDNALMPERFSDAELLGFVNQAIKRTAMLRPDLFATVSTITPTADTTRQELSASVIRIMELHRVVGGNALVEVDKPTMDQNYPEWHTEASGTPVNWMRHPRSPRGYYLYPAPASGTTISAEFTTTPSDYALSDTIALPDAYKAALVDCVVYLAESVDDEAVVSERAKQAYQFFLQALNADMQQRSMVDNDHAEVERAKRAAEYRNGTRTR